MSPTPSLYGQIRSAAHVEAACIETIKLWLPAYLREAERQFGYRDDSLPKFRSYTTSTDLRGKLGEDQTPALVVISPGTTGAPRVEGRGAITATWLLGVAPVVSAKTREDTDRLAKNYAAMLRTLLLQQSSLGGFASGISWHAETYTDVPTVDERTLASAQLEFHVDVHEVTDQRGGLRSPPQDPEEVPAWPIAETVSVTTAPKED